MWSLRLYSKLWGTLIGQAVYLQITDPDTPRIHTHTEKLMIPKTAGYGENCIQRFSTVIAVSQSLTAAGSARGWKSSLKRTITSGSLSAIYSIKISPWRSTDSQTGPWERERERADKKRRKKQSQHIYGNPHKRWREITEDRRLKQCRVPRQSSSNSCVQVSQVDTSQSFMFGFLFVLWRPDTFVS